MANQKNKIVENFILQQLKLINPDLSQIWSVKHKVLKKQFTLKKIKLKKQSSNIECIATGAKDEKILPRIEQWILQNVNRQTSILKRLESQNGPKCLKMIKTTNNVYLIYDQFPSTTIKRHILNNNPTFQERLALILKISKSLLLLHQKNIVLLHFSIQNMFFNADKPIFFSFWSLATTLQSQHLINTDELRSYNYANMPEELIKFGKYSLGTDIYCLGLVLKSILQLQQNCDKDSVHYRLLCMIQKILSEKVTNRPRLIEIIMQLQQCYEQSNEEQQIQKFVELQTILQKQGQTTPTFKQKNGEGSIKIKIKKSKTQGVKEEQVQIKEEQASSVKNNVVIKKQKFKFDDLIINKKQKDLKVYQMSSITVNMPSVQSTHSPNTPQYQPSSPLAPSTKSYSPSMMAIKSLRVMPTLSQTDNLFYQKSTPRREKGNQKSEITTHNRLKPQKQKNSQNIDILIKQFNKKRNLSVFLLHLSQFVMSTQEDFELSYLVIKYAIINLSTLLQYIQKYQHFPQIQKYTEIVKMQYLKLIQIKNPVQKYLLQFANQNKNIIREIIHEKQTSQRYFKEKTLCFSKQMILHCQKQINNKNQSASLLNNLFNTYMILKCIEEGTFQKFWQKIYQKQKVMLNNQKYFNDQKNYGIRYLKSRIAEIIKKKS